MADRLLTRFTEDPGGNFRFTAEIHRSSAGQPGLMLVIRQESGRFNQDELSVSIPDGAAFLAPVLEWLSKSSTPAPEAVTDFTPESVARVLRERASWLFLEADTIDSKIGSAFSMLADEIEALG